MFRIGCHLSTTNGYLAMGKNAVKINANTFQFFSRNPRGGAVKAFDMDDVEAYISFAKEHDLKKPLAHAPYVLNAAAKREDLREFARRIMREDLERLEYFDGAMYNFHPGSHVGQGAEQGIQLISEALNDVITPALSTKILLETMAGKGTEIGRSFSELRRIIDRVEHSEKVGVCLDTCHIFDAGYDIVRALDDVLQEFHSVIGIEKLCAIHLNDSIHGLESHKDRHAKIGEGEIGLDGMNRIINHPDLKHLPFYLETPNDALEGYQDEIKVLRSLYC